MAQLPKIGDIVQLNSGGPKMTVRKAEHDLVHCQWFAGSKLEGGAFPLDSVEPAQVEKK